jgi:hypothetical protein
VNHGVTKGGYRGRFLFTMLSLEQIRKIDSNFSNVTDAELIKVRDSLYELGQLIFDDWTINKDGSKYPDRILRKLTEDNKLNA